MQDYQDARISYYDIPDYHRHNLEPGYPPLLVSDIAPFPVWIVPPGWRMARLSDLAQVANGAASPENAGALLTLAGVKWAPVLDPLSIWGWRGALVTWQVEKTGDYLVLWRQGTR